VTLFLHNLSSLVNILYEHGSEPKQTYMNYSLFQGSDQTQK
ncbi:Hap43p-repressed protein, partial [Candida albicans P78042]